MHRIDADAHVANHFSDGDAGIGQPGTLMDAAWANAVQEEIASLIEAAGIALVKGDNTQLRDALDAFIATHAAVTSTHGAVSAPTATRMVIRDAAGRAQFADPAAAADAATKGFVETMATAWTALTAATYWGGVVSFSKDRAGIVHLNGSAIVGNVGAAASPCAVLPVGARPADSSCFAIVKGVSGPTYTAFSVFIDATTGAISLQPYGGAWATPVVGDTFFLSGISFKAA